MKTFQCLHCSHVGLILTKVAHPQCPHDLVPGDSPDPSLKCHPLKSQPQNTGYLRGFLPAHPRFSSPCWAQGWQGHFSSPVFAELALTWGLGTEGTCLLCPVWLHSGGPSPPCFAWPAASCPLVLWSQVSSSRKPFLCASLCHGPYHTAVQPWL